jgi:DDE superfamily endonuclease/Transposase/Helix-turn-helix domain
MGRGKDLTEGEQYTVKVLHEDGKSAAEIGRILNRSPTSIKNCIRRLSSTKNTSYKKRENSGRKCIIDDRAERRILRDIQNSSELRRLPKRQLAQEISALISKNICGATLVKTLKKNGIQSHVARKKPFISEENRLKRLQWARDHRNWTKEQWRRVLWTDESSISTDSNGKIRVWCRKDELYNPDCTQGSVKSGRKSIMVWGCINGEGINYLTRASSHMKGEEYGEIVLDIVFPMLNMMENPIFQEDNAPIHKCRQVQRLKEELEIPCMEWPPQSPDLNPIENVWRECKKWIQKNRVCRNERDLEEAVTEAWNSSTPEAIIHFIDSMPDRVLEVIKKKGYATRW